MSDKYKIIAVMGQAGAGKDSFVHTLIAGNYIPGAKEIVSCTTRPIRENEQDGVNYHYMTKEQFTEQVLNGEMLEATVFNNWCYGTSIKNLDKNVLNIGVFNPEGVEILQENPQIDLEVVYITASDKIRLLRQLNREEHPDCDEIVRRYGTDKKDFSFNRINEINPNVVIKNDGQLTLDELAQYFVSSYSLDNFIQNIDKKN